MQRIAGASLEVSFDSSSSSSFTLSSPKGAASAAAGLMWAEIDLGERYLVSAMYDDAASVSSSTLHKLCSGSCESDVGAEDLHNDHSAAAEGTHNELSDHDAMIDELSDHDAMIESAGMVLLQAYNELGRVQELFEVLETVFGSIAEVPPSLFLAAVCLQVSADLFVISRVALEKYLRGWTSVVGAPSIMVKPRSNDALAKQSSQEHHVGQKARNGQPVSSLYLSRRQYADLAEIYAIHVLVKGFRNPESALDWLRQADLLDDRKREIIKKVYTISQPQRAQSTIPRLDAQASVGAEAASTTGEAQTCLKYRDHHPETCQGDHYDVQSGAEGTAEKLEGKCGSIKKADSHVLTKAVRGFRASFFVKLLAKVVQFVVLRIGYDPSLPLPAQRGGKRIAVGGFTVLLFYALLKERRYALRIIRDSFKKLNMGLCDLWQLAFSVQLNPLAAVQPLPSSRAYGSRFV